MAAKSITHPDSLCTGPRTWTSTRNECPCRRAHLWPGGAGGRRGAGAVRLDRDREAPVMQRGDERLIELEQRLAPRAHDQWPDARRGRGWPRAAHRLGQLLARGEPAAARTIGADEIGVAKLAD